MRCECCDSLLSEKEIHQKHANTGEFLNTCNKCLDGLGIPVEGADDEDDVFVDSLWDEDYMDYMEDWDE